MKLKYKLSLGIFCVFFYFIIIITGGLVCGELFQAIFGVGASSFWLGFGVGSLLCISLLIYIDNYFFAIFPSFIPERPMKFKDPFWSQPNSPERTEKVEEKDDYENLDWLRHQYYEIGKSIQDLANEQGVSMMTIRKWIDKLEKR